MINILVDESYAFDYLAVLHIKYLRDTTNIQKELNFRTCWDYIKNQIGDALFNTIIKSEEYRQCYEANVKTYDAVEAAKTDQVKASYVDQCNYERFLIKQKIQEKFFNNTITETKIGYELYGSSTGI